MDFSFGLGDEELALMATGRGLGEDESSLSGFGVTFARPIVFTTFHEDIVNSYATQYAVMFPSTLRAISRFCY